jgi:hypothetical protein
MRFDELVAATPMFDLQLAESPDLPQNPLSGLVDHVAANAELYRTLLVADGSARLINHLLHRITVAAYANRHATEPGTHAADPDEVPHDPESALVAGAVLGVLIDWLRRGCPGTPAELADAVWPRLVAAASVTGLPKPAARRPARKPARNAAPKAAQKARRRRHRRRRREGGAEERRRRRPARRRSRSPSGAPGAPVERPHAAVGRGARAARPRAAHAAAAAGDVARPAGDPGPDDAHRAGRHRRTACASASWRPDPCACGSSHRPRAPPAAVRAAGCSGSTAVAS